MSSLTKRQACMTWTRAATVSACARGLSDYVVYTIYARLQQKVLTKVKASASQRILKEVTNKISFMSTKEALSERNLSKIRVFLVDLINFNTTVTVPEATVKILKIP